MRSRGQVVIGWFLRLVLRAYGAWLAGIVALASGGYAAVFAGIRVLTRAPQAQHLAVSGDSDWIAIVARFGDVGLLLPILAFGLLTTGFVLLYAAHAVSARLAGRSSEDLSRWAHTRWRALRTANASPRIVPPDPESVVALLVRDARDAAMVVWRIPQTLTSLSALFLGTAFLVTLDVSAAVAITGILLLAVPPLMRSFRDASQSSREVRASSAATARAFRRTLQLQRTALEDDGQADGARWPAPDLSDVARALSSRYAALARTQLIASISFATGTAIMLAWLLTRAGRGDLPWDELVLFIVVAKLASDGLRRAATSVNIAARQYPALERLHLLAEDDRASVVREPRRESDQPGEEVGIEAVEVPRVDEGDTLRVVSDVAVDGMTAPWWRQRFAASPGREEAPHVDLVIPENPLRNAMDAREALALPDSVDLEALLAIVPGAGARRRVAEASHQDDGAWVARLSRHDRVTLALAAGWLRGATRVIMANADHRVLAATEHAHWRRRLPRALAFVLVSDSAEAVEQLHRGTWVALSATGHFLPITPGMRAETLDALLSPEQSSTWHDAEDDED